MTAAVNASQRFTATRPCPICGGHSQLPQGQGTRCYGFLSSDGAYAHCTREEYAGGLGQGTDGSYAHRLDGTCRCGHAHTAPGRTQPADAGERPHAVRSVRHDVRGPDGIPAAVHHRRYYSNGRKSVWWTLPDGTPGLGGQRASDLPLYGIHELNGARHVVLTEGEPARDALTAAGIAALGTVCGATVTPSPATLQPLLSVPPIILWPDADDDGQQHMRRIGARLTDLGHPDVRIVAWTDAPIKGADAANVRDAVQTRALIAAAQPFRPAAPTEPSGKDGSVDAAATTKPWVRLADVAPEAVAWRWPGWLPHGKLVVNDGDPGLGKTTLGAEIIAAITTGRGLPGDDRTYPPAGAVILSAEDGVADTIRPRLEVAGADLRRVLVFTEIPDGEATRTPTLPDDLPYIEAAIRDVNAALVMIDPLMAYLGSKTNSFRDQDIRRALAPLAAMADRTGCTVLVIRHLNKAPGGSALYRGGGSIGIIGAARAGWLVGLDPDDNERRILAPTKSNLGPMPRALGFRLQSVPHPSSEGTTVARIAWDGTSPLQANQLLAQPPDEEERGALTEAIEWLRAELAGGSQVFTDLLRAARKTGISESTLRRAKKQLGVIAQKDGIRGPWVWRLPATTNDVRFQDDQRPPTLTILEDDQGAAEDDQNIQYRKVDHLGDSLTILETGTDSCTADTDSAAGWEEGEL